MIYRVENIEQTRALAARLADTLVGGEVVVLNGDLGAGKTTFTQGLARALGIEERVPSPTFTFMRHYRGRLDLYHYDMYRAQDVEELYELGLYEPIGDKDAVCVIEWNKFDDLRAPIVVSLIGVGENEREIRIDDPRGLL